MRRLPSIALGAVLALLGIAWFVWPNYRQQRSIAQQLTQAAISPDSPVAAASKRKPEITEPALPLNSPGHDTRTDLRLVAETLDTFRTNFPQEGNPTGSNAEITAALTGRNKVRFAFIAPNHPAINSQGELCDRWGTPFFFHAESATRMEIRSAGPDRKLWTADDIAFTP